MEKLLVFVFVKDVSIWLIYFVILKFNITAEISNSEIISNFSSTPYYMTVSEMFFGALYITLIPMILDWVMVSILWKKIRKRFSNFKIKLFVEGLLLHLPILLVWLVFELWKVSDSNLASYCSILMSLPLAGVLWVLLCKLELAIGK